MPHICVGIIKVIGSTSLGLYTGCLVTTAFSVNSIFSKILDSATVPSFKSFLNSTSKTLAAVLCSLGGISSVFYAMMYRGSPQLHQHPYLLYSSLVFPLSAAVFGILGYDALKHILSVGANPPSKKEFPSELDKSSYNVLSSDDETNSSDAEAHLLKVVIKQQLGHLSTALYVSGFIAFAGYIFSSIGLGGDDFVF